MDRVIAIASSIGFFVSLLFLALFVWHIQSLRTALSSCSENRIAAQDEFALSESSAAAMQGVTLAPEAFNARKSLNPTGLN